MISKSLPRFFSTTSWPSGVTWRSITSPTGALSSLMTRNIPDPQDGQTVYILGAMARFRLWITIGFLLSTTPASAFDFGLRIEPAAAIPITRQQSQLFGLGGGCHLRAGLGLASFLDFQVGLGLIVLPAAVNTPVLT